MPTREQLFQIWESEMEFPEIRRDDDPMKVEPKSFTGPFVGEEIGIIGVNLKTGDLRIIPTEGDKKNKNI